MNKAQIDKLWNKATRESIENGEINTRYRFAALVAAAEREACAKVCEEIGEEESDSFTRDILRSTATSIRARSNT